jgi:hypothetical protein
MDVSVLDDSFMVASPSTVLHSDGLRKSKECQDPNEAIALVTPAPGPVRRDSQYFTRYLLLHAKPVTG